MASHHVSNQRGKTARKDDQKQKAPASEPWAENAPRDSDQVRELTDDDDSHYFSRRATQLRDQMRECTREHEGSALFVSLAVGLGVGVLIGTAVMASRRRPASWRDRIAAEGIGRKFLDRLESMIPEALSERFSK
jgi:hypothetical protein